MKGKQEMKQVDINGEKEKMEKFLKQQDSDKYVKIFLIKITKKGIDLYKQEADQKTKKLCSNQLSKVWSNLVFISVT